MVPLPVPLLLDVMVIQLRLSDAVHAQALFEAETVKDPVPPVQPKVALPGDSV
jgi:hypothetical protein